MSRGIEHHLAPAGLAPGTGYSHAVAATGRLVAVAGEVALDADGNLVGRDDPEEQARQVFQNIGKALTAVGASFGEVVKLTCYLTDMSILPVLRRVRDEHVDTERPPASTAVQVAGLVRPEFLLEVEALAVVSE
jgi:enamine deaminase RidA (YjgF/YER057c/UK114 family)